MKCVFLVLFSICALLFAATVQGVDKSACALPKEVGPCRGSDLSYYHNTETKACEKFLYGGCQGNDNRFESKDECEKTCL